jgi:hypothetical protein
MKKVIAIFTILGLVSLIYFSSGCKKEDEKVEFVMKVDSIQHADTINVGDVFEIFFYAEIGPNECFAFKRFEPAFGPSNMQFTLYGEETKKSDCGGGEQYLNGAGAGLTDMTAGDWTITVIQPAGVTNIESKVHVLE